MWCCWKRKTGEVNEPGKRYKPHDLPPDHLHPCLYKNSTLPPEMWCNPWKADKWADVAPILINWDINYRDRSYWSASCWSLLLSVSVGVYGGPSHRGAASRGVWMNCRWLCCCSVQNQSVFDDNHATWIKASLRLVNPLDATSGKVNFGEGELHTESFDSLLIEKTLISGAWIRPNLSKLFYLGPGFGASVEIWCLV